MTRNILQLTISQNLYYLHLCVRRQFLSIDCVSSQLLYINKISLTKAYKKYLGVLYEGCAYGSAAGGSYGWYPVCL